MYSVNQEITDLKGEFEGGKSFSIDWYAKLRLGARAMLDQVNPDTLKREVPIYGGLTRSLQVYYCPADVEVPDRLFSASDRRVFFDYVPPRYFYDKPDRRNLYTIEFVNGVRFIVLQHPMSVLSVTVDEMNDATEVFGGNVTLTKNSFNIMPGAIASLQGTFTDTLYTVSRDISSSPINISSLLRGIAIVPVNVDTGSYISAVRLVLKTDDSNYYTVTSTQDSIGNFLRDGQNMVRFWMNNAVATGSPTASNITKWELQVQMTSGKSQTVVIGKITVQESELFVLSYQSNLMFVDHTTGAWKDTPASGDSINLGRTALSILHFETCRTIIQSAKTERVNSSESTRIDTNLARAYSSYYARFPSAEQPLSYDISPDIALSSDPFFEFNFGLPEEIGFNSTAENVQEATSSVGFADAEVPTGVFDGVNASFILAHTPNPTASLMVVMNGETLVEGIGYSIVNRALTLLTPYYTAPFIGLPFYVSYRYTI